VPPMKRILLVDDKDDVIDMLTVVLGRYGYHVTAFMEGQAALDALRGDDPFDLLIVDIRMAPVNGLEVIAGARDCRPAIPILVISAYDDPETVERAFELGCTKFIKKPLYLLTIVNPIREAFGEEPLPEIELPDGFDENWFSS